MTKWRVKRMSKRRVVCPLCFSDNDNVEYLGHRDVGGDAWTTWDEYWCHDCNTAFDRNITSYKDADQDDMESEA